MKFVSFNFISFKEMLYNFVCKSLSLLIVALYKYVFNHTELLIKQYRMNTWDSRLNHTECLLLHDLMLQKHEAVTR